MSNVKVAMEPIILASGSLRRQEYFRLLGLPFNIMPSPEEEPYDQGNPREQAERIAVSKVKRVVELLKGTSPPWICGADTLISLEGEVFGKPSGREDASRILNRLKGRTHKVFTAVALFSARDQSLECRTVTSSVTFAPLSPEEISWYLDTGEWQGTAGAYRIQGLGGCFVSGIQGSYSAIVGLPLHEFYAMLRDKGYPYGAPE